MVLSYFEKRWQNEFNQSAHIGGADYQISRWHEEGLESYLRYFLVYFKKFIKKDNSGKIILDVGCGPGTFSSILSQKGFKVFSVDYSREMIERAKEKTEGLSIDFQSADIYNLPFNDNNFDIIICLGVFQTLDSPQRAIEELRRVLKPQATLILTTLNRFSLGGLLNKKDRGLDVVTYSPYQFKKTIQKAGFSVKAPCGMYFFPKKLNLLSNFIFYFRIYKLFNLLFFIFNPLSHSFYIETRKL